MVFSREYLHNLHSNYVITIWQSFFAEILATILAFLGKNLSASDFPKYFATAYDKSASVDHWMIAAG